MGMVNTTFKMSFTLHNMMDPISLIFKNFMVAFWGYIDYL